MNYTNLLSKIIFYVADNVPVINKKSKNRNNILNCF